MVLCFNKQWRLSHALSRDKILGALEGSQGWPDQLGIAAKRRIQQRLVAFVDEQAKAAEDASRIDQAWARIPESIQ